MSQSVQETQNINYISQLRKIFVGRNNQPVTNRFKIDYRITDNYYFQVINAINQIVDIAGKNYQLFISKVNNRGQLILLAYQNSYSITDNVLNFVIDTYTEPWLQEIKSADGTEVQITIVSKDSTGQQVILRDNALAYPRAYIPGQSPAVFATQYVYIGDANVSGSFSAGQNNSTAEETQNFAFGENLIANATNQFVIGQNNELDGSKVFVVGNGADSAHRSNSFTVDIDGNVDANAISATAVYVNGEEISLSGIDEKFAATSAWALSSFESKDNADGRYAYVNGRINTLSGSLSAYATKEDLPTKISDLTNDSDFATTGYVQDAIDAATSGTGDLYETKVDANSKFNYLTGQISETNDNIYQNYALKSEIPTKVSQLTNDEDYASKTYVGQKDQEVLNYVGGNYTPVTTFNSSVTSLTNSIGSVNNNLTANYALKSSVPSAVSQLTNDVGYITGVNLDPYALKSQIPTKVSQLENDAEYITSADIPTVLNLSNKKKALIDRDVKEYNFRIHYQEDVEVFVNWQQTKDGVLYISPIDRYDLEEGKQIEVEQFVKPVGEFNAVSGNGIEVLNLPQTFGEDKILVFKRFITNDNGVYKQFAKFEFEYSNEDVEQLIHEPLTFIALEDNTKISFDKDEFSGYVGHEPTLALQYAINEGEWQTYTFGEEITLNQGDQLSFQNLSGTYVNDTNYYTFNFRSSQGRFNVEGSIKSLCNTLNKFSYHFKGLTGLVDASKLELPAVLTDSYNFIQMFMGCTSLTGVPKLPATTTTASCYAQMFRNCSSLETVPEDLLPATTVVGGAYQYMFYGCTSLRNAPKLPATTLVDNYNYQYMFYGCTSLRNAPELPALTLTQNCYQYMFFGCTSLRSIKLPATSLAPNCYFYLLNGCSNLTQIDVAFTSWGTNNDQYCHGWVAGLPGYGTFKKTTSLSVIRGTNNIPNDWIIENEDDLNFIAHGNVQIEIKQTGTPNAIALKYSTDGETFLDYTIGDVITLSAGQVLSMYNTTSNFSKDAQGSGNYYNFSISGTGWVEVEGHIDALVNHTNGSTYKYFNLFKDCTRIFDASELNMESDTPTFASYCQMFASCTGLLYAPKLPSTVADYCYQAAFKSCTSLTQAPKLSATTLKPNCYQGMFTNCTSLTALPKLPATTLNPWCYASMFQNCTSLTGIPENYLPATTLAANCYNQMFEGCTKIKDIPEGLLPATTLVGSDYYRMFKGCTSLTGVPKNLLPATVMKTVAYAYMFQDCTSLSTAPDINITEIQAGNQNAFYGMFKGCTSLQKTPDLHAKTLVIGCYSNMFENCRSLTDTGYIAATGLATSSCIGMFKGCSKLSSINVGFAEWDDIENATYNWVDGVAASGVFRKPSTLNRVEGPSNIPQNWKKIDNDAVTFICKDDNVEVALVQVGSPSAITMFYSVNGNDLQPYSVGTVVSLQPGDTVSFKNTTEYIGSNASNYYKFTTTGNGFVDVEGNVASLVGMSETSKLLYYTFKSTRIKNASKLIFPWETLGGSSYDGCFQSCAALTAIPQLRAKNVSSYAYTYMFNNCSSLSSVPEDLLPATSVQYRSYQRMFDGCTNLRNVPRLPATALNIDCYNQMFKNCTSLTAVPEDLLPATVAPTRCYQQMFTGCFNLRNAPALPATTVSQFAYNDMFSYCSNLSAAPELPATELGVGCYKTMFNGCSSILSAPELPATELEVECYYGMFTYCTALSAAPALPATKLAAGCYSYMFRSTKITSMTLPAKLLVSNCYNRMFFAADKLSSITVSFTQWDHDQAATQKWLDGAAVGITGNFYCPTSLDTSVRGVDTVPENWTINPASNRGESKGGSKKKGGDEIPDYEEEEIIEEQIPPIQKQIHITEFKDTNQSHIKGFIQPLPAPQIEDEDGQEKEDLPKEELRK